MMSHNPLDVQTNRMYLIASDDFHTSFIDGEPGRTKLSDGLESQIAARSIYNYMFKNELKCGKYSLDFTMPFLNFGGIDKHLIDSGLIPESHVYNKPQNRMVMRDKKLFHSFFDSSAFLPKTRFHVEDAVVELDFPIVAKPLRGMQGKGIQVFHTANELRSAEFNRDYIFCEMIDIVDEYRLLAFRGEMVQIAKRTPDNSRAKAVREAYEWNMANMAFLDNKSTAMKFKWTLDRPSDTHLGEMNEIADFILKKTELDFAGIDFAVDSNGEVWVIEANSAPGLKLDFATKLYRAVHRDWYGCDVNHLTQKMLENKEKELIELL